MKKILVAVILLVTTQLGYSQSDLKTTFFVKTGANISSLTEDDALEYDTKSGYSFGVGLDIPVAKDWMSVQTELKFIRKGFVVDYGFGDMSYNLSYVELPIRYMFRPKISDNCRFTGGVGGYFAAGVGGHVHGLGLEVDSFDRVEHDYDLGVSAVAGFEFNNHWMVNLEVEAGCIELFDNDSYEDNDHHHHHDDDDDLENTNVTVGLTLGYRF